MEKRKENSNLEYLGNLHFAGVLFAAFILHLMAGYGWSLVPAKKILDIPVRVLNIRLGDADLQEQAEMPPVQQDIGNAVPEDAVMHRTSEELTKKAPVPVKKAPEVKAPKPELAPKQEAVSREIPAPRQFVRSLAPVAVKGEGNTLGNSAANTAEIKAVYEQAISLWIQKFKVYPEEAKEKALQGDTVVRIRIDRRGNIRYSVLERSTGSEELDRAALDMVRRANPVPAVPNDYPQGEMFEFLVPVRFQIQ